MRSEGCGGMLVRNFVAMNSICTNPMFQTRIRSLLQSYRARLVQLLVAIERLPR